MEAMPVDAVPSVRDAWNRPDEVAAWMRARDPSVALASAEALFACARSQSLSAAGRIDALVALQQHRAMLDATEVRLIAAMVSDPDDPGDPDGKQWGQEDVAAALRLSPRSASNRIALAQIVIDRLPTLLKLLEAGRTTLMHVRKLGELTANVDDDTAAAVEALVAEKAQTQTVGEFGQSVRRAVLAADSVSAEQRHELARKDRRLSIQPANDGLAELYWLLPAEQAVHIASLLDGDTAIAHPGDPRVKDQCRSDALYERITRQATTPAEGPTPGHGRLHGMRPTVLVTVPLEVLSGDSDAPGELAGYGPIPAQLARRIAADPSGTWRRLVTDEQGQLVDYGRTAYRPPADLARHVIARDQTCCFPGCSRAASRCDLDHCVDWAEGGRTNARNLHALCPRHHHLKHETGWRYYELPNGDIEWASPTGHRYTRAARHYAVADVAAKDPPSADTSSAERPPLPDDPPF